MKLLYIGNVSGTSLQRINAFKRIGCSVSVIDPEAYMPLSKMLSYKWLFETGGVFLVTFISWRIGLLLRNIEADIVWVGGGDLISSRLVKRLKRQFGCVVNYNVDLPFGERDKLRWKHYFSSVPYYDLLLVRSNTDMNKPLRLGAKNVVAMYMLADEVVHIPQSLSMDDQKKWSSDVLFAGTWFPERGGFIKSLIEQGVPLTIYGDRWQKAPEWNVIKPYWKGSSLLGLEYSYAVQCSKICLGMVSEENNDLHTSRSMEVPSLGSLLCAKRTYEHRLMYEEGLEAVFWEDSTECASVCKSLLADQQLLQNISHKGSCRFKENGFSNEPFLIGALKYAMSFKI